MNKILIIITIFLISINSNAEDLKNNLTEKFTSNLNQYLNESLGEMFPAAEVGLTSGKTQKVKGHILVVKPLSDINDKETTLFTQGSIYFSDGNRETLNLGIGKRKLVNNDTLILGANIFYDHELEYDHQRSSLGLEAISSVGSLRTNQYFGISKFKSGLNGTQEKALNGSDVEIGAPLPYLPWTNLALRSFEWKGADGEPDSKGDEMSLEAKFPFGLNVEVGKRSNDGSTKDREFINLTWTCCNKKDEQNFGISDKAYNLTSVADQRFQKVKRQNLIVKQQNLALTVIGF
ncbi:inverse autotransporter beta domain-containing protein [Candidatus Pelagibacter sp.]|nr:inverse autotransporter beta domain-containing protein [Candidatus Pelagibacter sp.]